MDIWRKGNETNYFKLIVHFAFGLLGLLADITVFSV